MPSASYPASPDPRGSSIAHRAASLDTDARRPIALECTLASSRPGGLLGFSDVCLRPGALSGGASMAAVAVRPDEEIQRGVLSALKWDARVLPK